ncbi:type IV pilin [Natronomonas sp. CBA1123]|uniref:type IV pilin n=1 Tax=Natronomonas sp. CBA1123 TaxID=2668070 RepID=UPI0012EA69AC|nr:type IV pilin [Natronomonas sp. CBA1123]MUV85659.1 type IV pilin [Natronomonas sp. CBA1123]
MTDRAAAPVVGVVLLVAVTVLAATVVGTALPSELSTPARTAAFDVEADDTGRVTVTHLGGDAIDPTELRVRIRVDGERLSEQPPVPFFSARGFESGPTGPFNSATHGTWRAGESASLRVAGTNSPTLGVGATVEVRLYVDGTRIAVETATVQAASTGSLSTVASSSVSGASSSSSGT